VAVTATFRVLYVFVLIHHGSRRLLHFNIAAHPTAVWTFQQLREAIGFEGRLSLSHSRPGQYLCENPGRIRPELRAESSKITGTRPKGERDL